MYDKHDMSIQWLYIYYNTMRKLDIQQYLYELKELVPAGTGVSSGKKDNLMDCSALMKFSSPVWMSRYENILGCLSDSDEALSKVCNRLSGRY
jgi:hypothetical protein